MNTNILVSTLQDALDGKRVSKTRILASAYLLKKIAPVQIVMQVQKAALRNWSKWGYSHSRIHAEFRATPKWANQEEISRIRKRCRDMSRKTGTQHHVDHIIPLRGANVCGLHCEDNMQIITATENYRKGNKHNV